MAGRVAAVLITGNSRGKAIAAAARKRLGIRGLAVARPKKSWSFICHTGDGWDGRLKCQARDNF